MNQRHPQSPGTHHTAAVKKPTQRKVPAGKGLGWARAQRQSLRIDLCVPSTAPKARRCYLPLVPSPPPLVPRIRALRHESQHKKIVWIPPRYTLSWGLGDVSLSSKKLSEHKQGASVLRTHAPAAALHAQRCTPKGVSRRNFACSSSPARWRRCTALAARTGRLGRLDAGPDGLCPRPHELAPARCPCSGPRRASAAGAQQPRRVRMRSPSGSAEKRLHHTPDPRGPPKRLPPPRARPRRKGASRGPSPQPSPPPPHRRPTHCHLRSRPRPTLSLTAQPYTPRAPSTHLAAVRLLARPIPTRTGLGPETNIPASAGHPRAS